MEIRLNEQEVSGLARLKAAADHAVAQRDLNGARTLLEQAVSQPGADPSIWMSLAACRRGLGDFTGALAAIDGALALEPRFFLGLLMKASLLERLSGPIAAGQAYGVALTQVPPEGALNGDIRAAVSHARVVHARYIAQTEEAIFAELDLGGSKVSQSEARRATAFVERILGKRKVYHQEPVRFNYPYLPEYEYYEREEFPWIEEFESKTDEIRGELLGILDGHQEALTPYVSYGPGIPLDQWAELNHSPSWSAFYIYQFGRRVVDNQALCPKTVAAVSQLPQPKIPGRSPAAMFSVLKPRTRIPPHTGVANFRLVVHLPLIVPPGCGFRVGGETRAWRPGEAWVFDDSVEHEAWNDSDQYRTILICDVWHPRLSANDRQLILNVIGAMDRHMGADFTDADF